MRRVYPVSLCFFPALVHFFTKDLVVPSASNRLGSESSTHAYLKKGCLAAAHIFCGNKAPEVWIPGCGAFWVPDQNNALRFSGFQPGLRAAASVSRPTAAGGSWAEIAFHATLGQDAPCGLGVSGHSPQAPPRWGKVRFLSVLIFHCRWMRLLARRSAYIGQPVQSGSSQAGAKNCAGEGRCSRCLTRRLSI